MLKLGDPTLMGVVLPGVLVGILFAIPYVDRNPRRMAKYRPFAIFWGILWAIILIVLSYMGTPAYGIPTPPATRIIQDLAPEEGLGILRAIPYDELLPGTYVVNETDPDTLPGQLGEVFAEFTERVNEGAALEDDKTRLNDVHAIMFITEWQQDVKLMVVRIEWTDEDGLTQMFEKDYFLHRDRRTIKREFRLP